MSIWNYEKADTEFSKYIRDRDGRCMNPLCPMGLHHRADRDQLDCSHFYGRGVWITRYDPKNCIALCRTCHEMWENDKQGRYREVMIRILGQRVFNTLEKKAMDYIHKSIPYITRSQMIMECRKFLTKNDTRQSIGNS